MLGTMLNSVIIPPQTAPISPQPPLLIVHGLYGSARNWGVIAKKLSSERKVIAVDMRNHAASPWQSSHSYADMAGDLAEIITAHGGRADLLGHSMGGKAAMALALSHPGMLRSLIVADIAPVVYQHSQVQIIHALRRLDLSQYETRSEANQALAAHIQDAPTRAFLLQSLDLKAKRWRLNLDVLEAEMPKIMGFPEFDTQYTGPTLFLSGANSDYVQPAHRPQIKALFPKARFASIPGAGHWLHAEKPREFEAAVRVFLQAVAKGPSEAQ